MSDISPDFVALVIAATIYALDRFGFLDRFKKKSASDAAAELAIANQTIERLRAERNHGREVNMRLEQTRSLEPVLAQLETNATLQEQVLERLVHHNGSFAHMEAAMNTLVESLKLLTGFIAGVVEFPPSASR